MTPAGNPSQPSLFGPARRSMTLLDLQNLISRLVTVQQTASIWVTAELFDVSYDQRRGHCYMELVQKDESGTKILAKVKGAVWQTHAAAVIGKFKAATGQDLRSSMKVMVCVNVTHHAVFGLTYSITDIEPSFTMGDQLRLRREILERLKAEGILEDNRRLPWPVPAQRIAVVSSGTAAGYGDFIKHLYGNAHRLQFATRLYRAAMQGQATVPSVLNALAAIAADDAQAAPGQGWDAVVIIRGGGASADLAAFDSYELAAAIATFPLPVVVGIGHERDVTALDYVGAVRVKTPTAAADVFITLGAEQLRRLDSLGRDIATAPAELVAALQRQLATDESLLSMLPLQIVERRKAELAASRAALTAAAGRPAPERVRLDAVAKAVAHAAQTILANASTALDYKQKLLEAFSPDATLRRGYSITRVGGHAVTSAAGLRPGDTLTTTFADGSATSTLTETSSSK